MLISIVSQMTSLAHCFQIVIYAVAFLMIQMRNREHYGSFCIRCRLAMPLIAAPRWMAVKSALPLALTPATGTIETNPVTDLPPVRRILLFVLSKNGH